MRVSAQGFCTYANLNDIKAGDVVMAEMPDGTPGLGIIAEERNDLFVVFVWAKGADSSHFPAIFGANILLPHFGRIAADIVFEPAPDATPFAMPERKTSRGLYATSEGGVYAGANVDLFGGDRFAFVDLSTGKVTDNGAKSGRMTGWRIGLRQEGRKEPFWLD